MGRVIAVEYVTLDGVMEDPSWSGPYFGEELQSFQFDNLREADALLLGRVTYEGFAAAWPTMEEQTGDFGVRMNSLPKWVATSTPSDLTWNAQGLDGDPAEAVSVLKTQPGTLLLEGSADLFNHLGARGIIDEYRLMVFPVVAGSGKRLWSGRHTPQALTLAGSVTTSTGVVVLTYRPV